MGLCLQSVPVLTAMPYGGAVLKRLWSQADLGWNPAHFPSKPSNPGESLHHSKPQFLYVGIIIEAPAQVGCDH